MTVERARLETLRRSLLETHTALSPQGFIRAVDALIEQARLIGRNGERERISAGLLAVMRDVEHEKKEAA